MITRTLSLDHLKERAWEEVLPDVVKHQEVLTVRLPEGDTVGIQPAPDLKPLPVLEGFVPESWKDAILTPLAAQSDTPLPCVGSRFR